MAIKPYEPKEAPVARSIRPYEPLLDPMGAFATGAVESALEVPHQLLHYMRFTHRPLDDALAKIEEAYEASGGKSIYAKAGAFLPDAVMIGGIEKAIVKHVPKLAAIAKPLAESLFKKMAKGAVRTGLTGGAFETVKTGEPVEGLKAIPTWAGAGAAEVAAGAALGKAVSKIKPFKAAEKPTVEAVEKAIPEAVVAEPPATKAKKFTDKVWNDWVSSWTVLEKPEYGLAESGLYDLRVKIQTRDKRGMTAMQDLFGPMLEKHVGKTITHIDGTTQPLVDFGADIARSIRSGNMIEAGKESWLPAGERAFVKNVRDKMLRLKSVDPDLLNDAIKFSSELGQTSESLLTKFKEAGLLGTKDIDALHAANPFHVPYQRIFTAAEIAERGITPGGSRVIKRMFGSSRPIDDIIKNSAENYMGMTAEMEKQVFKRNAIDKLLSSPEMAGKVTLVNTPEQNIYAKIRQVFRAGDIKEIPEESLQTAFKVFKEPRVARNQVVVKRVDPRTGRAVWRTYELEDVALADAINMRTVAGDLQLTGALAYMDSAGKTMKNLKRTGVTLNPYFATGNLIRDTFMGLILDDTLIRARPGEGLKGFAKTLGDAMTFGTVSVPRRFLVDMPYAFAKMFGLEVEKMLGKEWQFTRFAREFERRGITGSEFFNRAGKFDTKRFIDIHKEMPSKGIKRFTTTLKHSDKNPFNWAENFLKIASEQTNRYIVTERAIKDMLKKRGINPSMSLEEIAAKHPDAYKDAMDLAHKTYPELTNFSEMGQNAKFIGQYSPFFTAQIAGGRTLYNAFERNPVGTSAKAMELITIPSIALWYRNHNQEWYKNLDSFERNNYWYISEHVRVPKPFEMGMIFGSVPERMMDLWYDNDPKAVEEAMEGIVQSMPAGMPVPPAIQITQGLISGKHPYFKSPIDDPFARLAGEPGHLISKEYTSEAGKLISKLTAVSGIPVIENMSPMQFDYVVGELFGRLGRYGLDGSTSIIREMEEGKTHPPGRPITEHLFGRVYVATPAIETGRTKWRNRFYEYWEEANGAYKESASETGLWKYKQWQKNQYRDMSKAKRKMAANRKALLEQINPLTTYLTPKEIENKIKESNRERNDIAREAVYYYERAIKSRGAP